MFAQNGFDDQEAVFQPSGRQRWIEQAQLNIGSSFTRIPHPAGRDLSHRFTYS
jgi:hypothetical protein